MTQQFVTSKIVTAWPATRTITNQSHSEGQVEPGYAVLYADGYKSWCPKDKFEAEAVPLGNIGHLPPHQQRVVAELEQLADRVTKLEAFLAAPFYATLDEDEQQLLKMQADAMVMYMGILNNRAAKFGFGK